VKTNITASFSFAGDGGAATPNLVGTYSGTAFTGTETIMIDLSGNAANAITVKSYDPTPFEWVDLDVLNWSAQDPDQSIVGPTDDSSGGIPHFCFENASGGTLTSPIGRRFVTRFGPDPLLPWKGYGLDVRSSTRIRIYNPTLRGFPTAFQSTTRQMSKSSMAETSRMVDILSSPMDGRSA
jgi:hypothetical protein